MECCNRDTPFRSIRNTFLVFKTAHHHGSQFSKWKCHHTQSEKWVALLRLRTAAALGGANFKLIVANLQNYFWNHRVHCICFSTISRASFTLIRGSHKGQDKYIHQIHNSLTVMPREHCPSSFSSALYFGSATKFANNASTFFEIFMPLLLLYFYTRILHMYVLCATKPASHSIYSTYTQNERASELAT